MVSGSALQVLLQGFGEDYCNYKASMWVSAGAGGQNFGVLGLISQAWH